jgi:DNA-binding CsgD family transcriptional regulator
MEAPTQEQEDRLEDILFSAEECRTPKQFNLLVKRLQTCIPFRYMVCGYGNPVTYNIAEIVDVNYPTKFLQWYFKTAMIRKDPLFHEWMRTQKCQTWADCLKKKPHLFDSEYIAKVKEFDLHYRITGGFLDTPRELVGYFSFVMQSEKACRDFIGAIDDMLPVLYRALKKSYQKQIRFPSVLSEKKKSILELAAQGNTRRMIAFKQGITERTVQMHLSAIQKRLNAKNETHAVAIGLRCRLIS